MSEETKETFERFYFIGLQLNSDGVEVVGVFHTLSPQEYLSARGSLSPLEKAEALSNYDAIIEYAKSFAVSPDKADIYRGLNIEEFKNLLINEGGGGNEESEIVSLALKHIREFSQRLGVLPVVPTVDEEETIVEPEKSEEQLRLESEQARIATAPHGGNFLIGGYIDEDTGKKHLEVFHKPEDPTIKELWGVDISVNPCLFDIGIGVGALQKKAEWESECAAYRGRYKAIKDIGEEDDYGPMWWSNSISRKVGRQFWGLKIDPNILSDDDPQEHLIRYAAREITYTPYSSASEPLDISTLDKPILPTVVAKKINALISLFETNHPACPGGLLLYGPPGTGKTITARYIAGLLRAGFFDASTAALKKGFIGQSGQAVLELWTKVKKTQGIAVIFIDECETVFGRRGGKSSSEITEELLNEFLKQWSGLTPGKILVIGATNHRESIDPSVLSRFGEQIELPAPDRALRKQIIAEIFKKKGIGEVIDQIAPDKLSDATQGKSGRELEAIASATALRAAMSGRSSPLAEDFYAATGEANAASSSAVDRSAGWDSLIIAPELKEELKNLSKFISNAEALAAKGFDVPRGMLLYGPPGTGKTLIAKVMANESGVAFLEAKGSDLKGEYQGHTAPKIEALFADARRKAPCILFVDEIESSFPSRSGSATEFSREAVTTFLKETDGVAGRKGPPVFILGATNHPDAIDPAVLSRIPNHVSVGLPGKEARTAMLKIFIGNLPHNLTDADYEFIADATDKKSGRDLHSLCIKAQQFAVADVGFDADRVMINASHFKRILS